MSATPAEIKIGLIGLDTSHVPAFTKLLNDSSVDYHVPGGKVVAGFPGASPDFSVSIDRVKKFTAEIRDNYGVEILDSARAVAEASDAILLTSVDGRAHLKFFEEIAPLGKPTFIDKPFAVTSADARAIANLAKEHNVPLLSASSLRYAQPLADAMAGDDREIIGADFYGPCALQEVLGYYFWYGIHTAEMLFSVLGKGCKSVSAVANGDHDVLTGVWQDGRIGTARGNRKDNNSFGGTIHRAGGSQYVDAGAHPKPGYAGLLERILPMFRGETPDIDIEETLEIIRFLEAANESRLSGKPVEL